LAIASETAEFGFVEPRVGLAAIGGGALQRLAREMPMKDAMMMILTGKRISANEALRASFINQVVPHSDLMSSARELAHEILKGAPLAVQASKQVVLQSRAIGDLKKAIKTQYELVELMLKSQDAIEGPLAFAEKRIPKWIGQ
jgi:enoyl-CoA hydratase/carnithine racemase